MSDDNNTQANFPTDVSRLSGFIIFFSFIHYNMRVYHSRQSQKLYQTMSKSLYILLFSESTHLLSDIRFLRACIRNSAQNNIKQNTKNIQYVSSLIIIFYYYSDAESITTFRFPIVLNCKGKKYFNNELTTPRAREQASFFCSI